MRILLDTHVILAMLARSLDREFPRIAAVMGADGNSAWMSAASLWEIAIKHRLGKLEPGVPVDAIEGYLAQLGVATVAVSGSHAVAALSPEPATRDPFDRMLLAQCAVEGMRLATVDRGLVGHPLALPNH